MTRLVTHRFQSVRACARGNRGFTLLELMIVVAVIAILAAIAYPAYQGHVIKTRRTAATGCALEAAQFMERFYTTYMRYHKDKDDVDVALPEGQCQKDIALHYTIRLSTTNAVTANSYEIEAVPKGIQESKDTECGTLSINHAGQKAVSTSTDPAACW